LRKGLTLLLFPPPHPDPLPPRGEGSFGLYFKGREILINILPGEREV